MNSTVIQWLRELWRFYLSYTKTGVHTAATAGLAIFGLLTFVDDAFAVLAITSYVLPPVIMYALADEPADEHVRDEHPADADESTGEAMLAHDASRPAEGTTTDGGAGETDRSATVNESRSADERENGDTDSDRDDGDTDSDSDGRDTDSDGDDGDTDSDSDDGDTDSDTDDGDTDSDRNDGDTDSDSDDGDTDSDRDDGDTDSDSDS